MRNKMTRSLVFFLLTVFVLTLVPFVASAAGEGQLTITWLQNADAPNPIQKTSTVITKFDPETGTYFVPDSTEPVTNPLGMDIEQFTPYEWVPVGGYAPEISVKICLLRVSKD